MDLDRLNPYERSRIWCPMSESEDLILAGAVALGVAVLSNPLTWLGLAGLGAAAQISGSYQEAKQAGIEAQGLAGGDPTAGWLAYSESLGKSFSLPFTEQFFTWLGGFK